MMQEQSARMTSLGNGEFESYFNASLKDEGTILASQGSYGQYGGRPLKRGFHKAIPTTKLEIMEPLENHGLETCFYASMKCKDANGQVRRLRLGFYTKLQKTNFIAHFLRKTLSQECQSKHEGYNNAIKSSIQFMNNNHNTREAMKCKETRLHHIIKEFQGHTIYD